MVFCENWGTRINPNWKYCTVCGTRIYYPLHPKKTTSGKTNTIIDKDGYRRFTDSNELVHRYVVEKSLGRKLGKNEVIHHINLKKLDNRPENLRIFSNQQAHKFFHENLDHSKCPDCGEYLVKKKGKYGVFWGCTGYPYCSYTRPVPSTGGKMN